MTLELHYNRVGKGKPAVLLHGLFGSGKNLNGIAHRLIDQGYEVYLPDLRNHGRSPHSDDMSYPVMADDITHFLQQHNIRAPLLLGHSMGGKVAMTLALQDENCCRHLIVMDIAPVDYGHSFERIINSLQGINLDAIESRKDAEAKLAETLEPAALRQFLLQNLVRVENRFQWRLNLSAFEKAIPMISAFPEMSPNTFNKATLFIGGEESDYLLPRHQSVIQHYFPQAEVKKIAGAGHWLHAEQPDATWKAIRQFLMD